MCITMGVTDPNIATQIIGGVGIKCQVMDLSVRMYGPHHTGTMIVTGDPLDPSYMKNIIWNSLSTLYSED